MTTKRVTCYTVADIDAAPNLENDVRNDKHWLLLDMQDHKRAVYETTTNDRGETKSVRVKIREDRP
jgi:hypothetical protein